MKRDFRIIETEAGTFRIQELLLVGWFFFDDIHYCTKEEAVAEIEFTEHLEKLNKIARVVWP